MSHALPTGEVHQLVLIPLMRDSWRLCDRTVASSDADSLVAYVESVDGEGYEVVWVVAGAGVETFTRLEEILCAALERLSSEERVSTETQPSQLSLVPAISPSPRKIAH